MPPKGRWFVAMLVQELRVAGVRGNVVWRNFHLIRANSPEVAYRKANRIGKSFGSEYRNSERKTVRSVFRGISELVPIYEELIDGAEILFESRENLTDRQIRAMIGAKNKLAAFQSDLGESRAKPGSR